MCLPRTNRLFEVGSWALRLVCTSESNEDLRIYKIISNMKETGPYKYPCSWIHCLHSFWIQIKNSDTTYAIAYLCLLHISSVFDSRKTALYHRFSPSAELSTSLSFLPPCCACLPGLAIPPPPAPGRYLVRSGETLDLKNDCCKAFIITTPLLNWSMDHAYKKKSTYKMFRHNLMGGGRNVCQHTGTYWCYVVPIGYSINIKYRSTREIRIHLLTVIYCYIGSIRWYLQIFE